MKPSNINDSVLLDEANDIGVVNSIHSKNIINTSPSYALSNRTRRSLRSSAVTRKFPVSKLKRSPLKGIKEPNRYFAYRSPEPAVRHTNKKRKITRGQQNDTIIILSDDDGDEVTQRMSTSRPIPILINGKTPKTKTKKKPLNKVKIFTRSKRRQSLNNRKSVTAGDDEIKIVWSSENNDKPDDTQPEIADKTTNQPSAENSELFHVDAVGNAENLRAMESDTDVIIVDENLKAPTKSPKKNNNNAPKSAKKKIKRKTKWNKPKIQVKSKGSGSGKLRQIVVDGCNVAMSHKNGTEFSEKGIELVLNYFYKRGHKVKVFIPQYQRVNGRDLLEEWYKEGIVVFTPSRRVGRKRITPYDDRYILDYALKCDGIVISSDQFIDLWNENIKWHPVIEKRLLAPTFVDDIVMFPEDPLGISGPCLDKFLRH